MRPNSLTRQHAEEVTINALVMQRDALSREVGQLQNHVNVAQGSKEAFETQRNLLRNEIGVLECTKADLTRAIQQKTDDLNDLKEDIKINERSAVNMKKATDAVRKQRDEAVVGLDEVEETYAMMKKEHQAAVQKLKDEKKFLSEDVERYVQERRKHVEAMEEAQQIVDTARADLEIREKALAERLEIAERKEKDTYILRARLKSLAEQHNIHFSIAL